MAAGRIRCHGIDLNETDVIDRILFTEFFQGDGANGRRRLMLRIERRQRAGAQAGAGEKRHFLTVAIRHGTGVDVDIGMVLDELLKTFTDFGIGFESEDPIAGAGEAP